MITPHFLNLKMLVQSACVYVRVGVWCTCVHICIIYISNIYYIYLYHISVEVAMVTSHSTYVILSITLTSPFCAFIRDFLVSHQKFLVGSGRGARRGTWENV